MKCIKLFKFAYFLHGWFNRKYKPYTNVIHEVPFNCINIVIKFIFDIE